ncbi:MAG: 4Fe-4S binding protein [Patescibacteria group bacterium]|nr:4Fe-4S binding protein [Patescibacteria group bacterium]
MTDARHPQRTILEVNHTLVAPWEPKTRTVQPRKPADYPHVTKGHLAVAERLSNPAFMGPPLCDELIALVRHVFTEEEAEIVRHLGTLRGKTAEQVARAARRPLDEVRPILDRLSENKRSIAGTGPEATRLYRMPPLVPGMFEMILIGESIESLSPWHRQFAELFQAVYETGYLTDYRSSAPMVRALPVHQAADLQPAAIPTGQLEAILDRFDTFGIGQCQCRTAMHAVGKGCDAPRGNCVAMGRWAEKSVAAGWFRAATRAEVLDAKLEAESAGLVNWMVNVESTTGQASCSCCRCCCYALRTVSQFSVPGLFAPPHFMPRFDYAKCTYCGRCAKQCPTAAIVVDPKAKTHELLTERCIGCGLCATTCRAPGAVQMTPTPNPRRPYRNWFSFITNLAPGIARNVWHAWRVR